MARAITSEHTNAQVYETSVISTILFGKKNMEDTSNFV